MLRRICKRIDEDTLLYYYCEAGRPSEIEDQIIKRFEHYILRSARGDSWKIVATREIIMDSDDAVSLAMAGFLEALRKYDWSSGNQLKSYARHRIRGAILDEGRNLSILSRREVRDGADPVVVRSIDDAALLLRDARISPERRGEDDCNVGYQIVDSRDFVQDVLDRIEFQEIERLTYSAGGPRLVSVLRDRSAGYSQPECGRKLGITGSRVSQLEKKIRVIYFQNCRN